MSANYVFIADDFTGASDTLATLARAGLEVRLFLDMPTPAEAAGLDAFGVATDARSLMRPELEALMRRLAAELEPHAPRFVHLKICSTFDSSPEIGNFALAMRCLHERLSFGRRAIIGGQPSLGRHCVFGNLFARAGDGRMHRIDRHPVMRAHPVTPMTESDLVRHFGALGGEDAVLVDHLALTAGAARPDGGRIVLYDTLDEAGIVRIGGTISTDERTLCVGASSVAEAFVGGAPARRPAEPLTVDGPLLAFVGSRSAVSAEQVRAATSFSKIEIAARDLADDRLEALAEEIAAPLRRGFATLAFLSADSAADCPPQAVAAQSAKLVSATALRARPGGLMVAGGDTSSAIVRALAPRYLQFLGDIDPGVPLCKATFADGRDFPMVLKGGQVGLPDLFDRTANGLLRTD